MSDSAGHQKNSQNHMNPTNKHREPGCQGGRRALERHDARCGMLLSAPQQAWVGIVLGVVLMLFPGCKSEGDGAPDAGGSGDVEEERLVTVPVEASPATRVDMQRTVSGNTTLRASEEITVVSEIAGHVRTVDVEAGDVVVRGQVVARIENADVALTIRTAQQSVGRFDRELEALRPLYDQGYLSRQAFEETEFQLTTAQNDLERAQQTAGTQVVRSPVDAAVTERRVTPGAVVTPNQALLVLSTIESLEAHISVPERELLTLREGQAAVLRIDALASRQVAGEVLRIDPVVDPTTGTVNVRVRVLGGTEIEPGLRLRPGMFANVRITTDVHLGVVSIPKRAVLYEGETPYVFVLRDTVDLPEGSGDAARGPTEGFRVQRVVIETGYDDATMVEVLTGIAEGDRVIVAGQNGLDPDSVVTVDDASQLLGASSAPDAVEPSAETEPSTAQAADASGAASSDEGSSP